MVTALFSCSSDELVENASAKDQLSVLDGDMLSFKDEESFVKEYDELASLNKNELKDWVSAKKMTSLLNTLHDDTDMEEDVIPDSRIIYSDALKSILNADSKVKVNGKVLWLNERSFYLLSEVDSHKNTRELIDNIGELQVYGSLLNISSSGKSSTSRTAFPNENGIKTFVSDEINVSGSRLRHVLDLYNETIVLNDIVQSSKMYLRTTLQYRSCSTFRCTWKEAMNERRLSSSLSCASCEQGVATFWYIYNVSPYVITGTQTFLVGNWYMANYVVANPYVKYPASGLVTCSIEGVVPTPQISLNVSWY
ncbi:hypothetical protein [Flavobacterium cutihirudinis]|uniref:hypothetical protein n=1 Tax=Flavobacterium cutihirudinis TaxID=1265740 RepID=UPI0011C067C9|nr:hypothetical protein [Flavobacterium cutihirudinis]